MYVLHGNSPTLNISGDVRALSADWFSAVQSSISQGANNVLNLNNNPLYNFAYTKEGIDAFIQYAFNEKKDRFINFENYRYYGKRYTKYIQLIQANPKLVESIMTDTIKTVQIFAQNSDTFWRDFDPDEDRRASLFFSVLEFIERVSDLYFYILLTSITNKQEDSKSFCDPFFGTNKDRSLLMKLSNVISNFFNYQVDQILDRYFDVFTNKEFHKELLDNIKVKTERDITSFMIIGQLGSKSRQPVTNCIALRLSPTTFFSDIKNEITHDDLMNRCKNITPVKNRDYFREMITNGIYTYKLAKGMNNLFFGLYYTCIKYLKIGYEHTKPEKMKSKILIVFDNLPSLTYTSVTEAIVKQSMEILSLPYKTKGLEKFMSTVQTTHKNVLTPT